MNKNLNQCLSFLNSQVTLVVKPPVRSDHRFRAVTLSRQIGSGGHAVAEMLVEFLRENDHKATCPWTIFDRNLVEKVLTDHHLPTHLAKFFPEDRITELQDIMDETLGLQPEPWTLVEQASESILQLAALGNVVLIGRGGNIITRKLPGVLHVRLVGSLETRARRLAETRGMTHKSALSLISKEDLERRRYIKKNFGKDITDPLQYHLVLNTDLISPEIAAQLIGKTVLNGA